MKDYASAPYRIKMVEPIRQNTRAEREKLLEEAGHNPFALRSEDIYIDLLTDSGTGTMSQNQWGAMMQGDEAYAGSRSFFRLERTVLDITGYKYFIPAHQGRGAEQVALPYFVKKKGMAFISNMHFDTTRAHVELAGARAIDCITPEGLDTETPHPFKGNFDNEKLTRLIEEKGEDNIAGIILTVTNNSAGGQPVSLENMKETKRIADHYRIPIIIDGARYAENAFFIKQREKGHSKRDLKDIAREMFALGDLFLMSAKKDGLVNMGGIITIKESEALFEHCRTSIVPLEGFPTYGGMSGRDMEATAVGLSEALDEEYLEHRTDQVRYLGDKLIEAGVPIQTPTGGHAVFVDCAAFAPHIPYDAFPAQSVVNQLYLESGVRAVEIGSFLMGRDPDTKENLKSPFEFMRLTIPRRTYTYRHLDHVAEGVKAVYAKRDTLKGYTFAYEPPVLRHFTARLEPL